MSERTAEQWHEYLVNIEYTPELIDKFDQLRELYEDKTLRNLNTKIAPYRLLAHSNLLDLNCQKQIIKEPIKKFPGYKKYPPYAFRFQCLTTGRISKYIKIDDWAKFGITPEDGKTGGLYPYKMDIKDKLKPIFDKFRELFLKALEDYRQKHNLLMTEIYELESQYNWFQKYNEYLNSECWHNKRKRIIALDDGRCLITSQTKNIQVHHIHYNNVGNERDCELITLSEETHKKIHGYSADDLIKRREIEFMAISNRCKNINADIDNMWRECWSHNNYWLNLLAEKQEFGSI